MLRQLSPTAYAAGQIDPSTLPELKAEGIARVINNRPDNEEFSQPSSAVMAAAAAQAGMGYEHLPVATGLDPETIIAARAALAEPGATLLYCKSGVRSALLWAAAEAAGGADIEGIIAAAANAGFELRPYRALLAEVARVIGAAG
ncbi:MAG: TIGR01244 family sulfur transferase [Sphingomonadaceae bacterium]|nr:TIGR01244 family sulfur transferase [Sphingomonadaceae bacterium]